MPLASRTESARIAAETFGWVLSAPLSVYGLVLPGAV